MKEPQNDMASSNTNQQTNWTDRLGLLHGYSALPDHFYSLIEPSKVPKPELLRLNNGLAEELGLNFSNVSKNELASLFAGNEGTIENRYLLAMAYSGHQFAHFNPVLGDGRAALIGEVLATDQIRYDLHLKGSGPTPYSRQADGKAVLGPVMREYIVSEAMHALGIPTTRSLAITLTGEKVLRHTKLPGAVLTRVAQSHIRIGTFQYFAARGDLPSLKTLLEYTIKRHGIDCENADNFAHALLLYVITKQASLIAQWMSIGFIHGVMNTDNMTISGHTIDYGPCAFMDHYDHYKVYSSIDRQGRYAFGRQPQIGKWNLARLAEALLPLLSDEEDKALKIATSSLEQFDDVFSKHWLKIMGKKLGIAHAVKDDEQLILEFLTMLQSGSLDFTNSFAKLSELSKKDDPEAMLIKQPAWSDWSEKWRKRLNGEGDNLATLARMKSANPIYIPRNHLIEQAIKAGQEDGNFDPMDGLIQVLKTPFTHQTGAEHFTLPPTSDQIVHQTFCGT